MSDKFYELYEITRDDWSWFVVDYFGKGSMDKLDELAEQKDPSLYSHLNDVWYHLPDNQFNIRENPSGWSEFLRLLEFED